MKKRFSLTRVFKQRDKLFQQIRPYIDANIVGEVFRDLVDDVYRVLPNYVSHDAVFESVRTLVGAPFPRKTAAEFAWRIAGNIDQLLAGKPVIPWTGQAGDEWLPIQILRVDHAVRNKRPGFTFECRALAGSSCPMVFEQFLSRGSCSAIAQIAGFSRAAPYMSGVHFTNLRLWALIEAAKSTDAPSFNQVDCTAAMKEHNKKLIAIRTRALPCPRNFAHPCEHCELGYNECPAAIFPLRLEKKQCPACDDVKYFDTTRNNNICMACARNGEAKKIAET